MDKSISENPNIGSINEMIQKIENSESSKIKKIKVDVTNFVITDKMIDDLESQLDKEENEADLGKNKTEKENLENNMKILNIIRRRILLKQKAFELLPAVIKSNYSSLCRFFLLKAQLYEITFFLTILYSSENQLKLPLWDEFQKKSGFAKFVSVLMGQENNIYDLLDECMDKARVAATVIGKKQSVSMILKYLNDDSYQNPEPVLKVVLPLIINQFLNYSKPMIKSQQSKAVLKGKLKILLQLVTMTYDYGVFEIEEEMMDQFDVFYQNRKEKDIEKLEQVFKDLTF
jgi:hypothetical protein